MLDPSVVLASTDEIKIYVDAQGNICLLQTEFTTEEEHLVYFHPMYLRKVIERLSELEERCPTA